MNKVVHVHPDGMIFMISKLDNKDVKAIYTSMFAISRKDNVSYIDINDVRELASIYKLKNTVHEIDLVFVKCHYLNVLTIVNPHFIIPNPMIFKYVDAEIEDEIKQYETITNRTTEYYDLSINDVNAKANSNIGNFFEKRV